MFNTASANEEHTMKIRRGNGTSVISSRNYYVRVRLFNDKDFNGSKVINNDHVRMTLVVSKRATGRAEIGAETYLGFIVR